MERRIVIIGGGLAGLAAATALADRFPVTLVEARPYLGGRASSFRDPETGQLIDACQHATLGCCTNLNHFFRTVGIDHYLETHRQLWFMTRDRRVSSWPIADARPPLHQLRGFVNAHFLSLGDKLRIAWGLRQMMRSPPSADPPFVRWLAQHRQTERTIARFWDVVLVSALNEATSRMGLRYARKVLVDGFLRHRDGPVVYLPRVPLGRLYGDELQSWLARRGVEVRTGTGVEQISVVGNRVDSVQLRDGRSLSADVYLSTVPFPRLLRLLPAETIARHEAFSRLRKLELSPITSIHLWYDRPVVPWPHVVLVGCEGQWVFRRGETRPGEHYVQVVVSAARQFQNLDRNRIRDRIVSEVETLFPQAAKGRLLRARVISDKSATFSVTPGVDALRPAQSTPLANLFLAGDWTQTGWPATMEGAVRSGYLAAEAITRLDGRADSFLQSDLDGRIDRPAACSPIDHPAEQFAADQ